MNKIDGSKKLMVWVALAGKPRTIKEIAKWTHLSTDDVAAVLVHLKEQGEIEQKWVIGDYSYKRNVIVEKVKNFFIRLYNKFNQKDD